MAVTDPREERVLVLAPTGRDARLIADELDRAGFAAHQCENLAELCAGIEAGAALAVLAEEALPQARLADLVAVLGRQPPWSDLPILILTGKGTPSAGSVRRLEALEPSANITQLERPVRTRTLLSSVRAAMRARRRQYDVRGHVAEREQLAETLELAVAAADLGSWDWHAATDVMTMSARAATLYGVLLGGRYGREELRRLIHPDHRDHARAAAAHAAATLTDYDVEYPLVRDDGSEVWVAARGRGVYAADGSLLRMLGVVQDITARKRAEEALRESEGRHRLLAALAAATQPLLDPGEIMAVAARLLAEHVGADRCAYAEVEEESVYAITGDHCRGVSSIVGRWAVEAFGADHGRRMRANEPHVVEDTDADPGIEPADLAAYRSTDIRAVICVPLHKGGRLTAAMAVHQATPRRWTPAEVELVQAVVARCWETLERARADRARREGAAQLRLITDTVPALIGFVDADRRYRFVNRQYEEWFNLPRSAVEGKHLAEVVGPEAYEHLRPHVERGLAGEQFEFEAFAPYPTGDRYIHAAFVPQVVGDTVRGYFSLITDVTERTLAQRSLRASEERYRVLATATSDVVYRMSADWSEMQPLDGRGMVASNVSPIRDWLERNLPPQEHDRVREAITRAIAAKGTFEIEHRINRPDGSLGWTLSRAAPILDASGEIVEWFGTARDVTDRRRAEDALRQAEERFRAAVAATSEIMWTNDADGRMTADQPGWAAFTGQSPAEYQGFGWAAAVHPDDAGPTVDEWHRAVEGRRMFVFEHRVRRRDGLYRDFSIRAVPLLNPDGSVREWVGTHTDITERNRAEAELRDADRKKDDFLALLAHELRNPLAPLRNGLQVMRLAQGDPAALTKSREMMDRQLAHMVRLIDDLLDVSRINRNKMELRRSRLTLADVVAAAVETSRPGIDAAGHALSVTLPDQPVHLDGDATRLAQVFANLLSNSAKYTPPGGRIRLEAQVIDGQATVTVRDTGIGIPAASLSNIFDMFSQVDRSIERSTGGLGIGLALVKGLVEMHGGTVAASSPGNGQGTTFTVRLPVWEAPSPSRTALSADRPFLTARSILVVDDNRDSAESMAEMLRLLGHEVSVAHDGLEAVEKAGEIRPEVVLMDMGMPRLNGYDATRRIRGESWGKAMTIVALTGWGQDTDRSRSREAGCDGHLVKPVDLTDLEALLVKLA